MPVAGDLPGELARALLAVITCGWGSVTIVVEHGRIKRIETTTSHVPPQEEGQERELIKALEKGK